MRSLVWLWINCVMGLVDSVFPTSGWGLFLERCNFVSWFPTFVFREVPGTVPECLHTCGFEKNSSSLDRASKMRNFLLLNFSDSFFSHSAFNILENLCYIILIGFRNGRVCWLAVPGMFLLCSSFNGCQLPLVSHCCHLRKRTWLTVVKTDFSGITIDSITIDS